jgi:hypothetical protein
MRQAPRARRGVAATELAVLLPFLAFLFVVGVDWSRLFYYSVTIDNCARNGALWASDPYTMVQSPYKTMTEAALADAPNLTPPPDVTRGGGVDANGYNYVDCTVRYSFQTLTNLPGVPRATQLTRTVRMYQPPRLPR